MQLFGYRHGLILYNPIVLIGLAGLFLGAFKKNTLLTVGAVAFFVYALSII